MARRAAGQTAATGNERGVFALERALSPLPRGRKKGPESPPGEGSVSPVLRGLEGRTKRRSPSPRLDDHRVIYDVDGGFQRWSSRLDGGG